MGVAASMESFAATDVELPGPEPTSRQPDMWDTNRTKQRLFTVLTSLVAVTALVAILSYPRSNHQSTGPPGTDLWWWSPPPPPRPPPPPSYSTICIDNNADQPLDFSIWENPPVDQILGPDSFNHHTANSGDIPNKRVRCVS